MEVRLTLCTVVVTVMFGGCLSEYCATGASEEYCPYGCCGGYPKYCCSAPNTTVIDSWIIAVIVIGVILLVATFIATFCCVRRSRGARGIVVNRQGMTTITTASTVNITNGHQQPSALQFPQHSANYNQQPATSPQQPVTSNFQQQYYPTGQTHAHTLGYAPLPSYSK